MELYYAEFIGIGQGLLSEPITSKCPHNFIKRPTSGYQNADFYEKSWHYWVLLVNRVISLIIFNVILFSL